MSAHHAPDWVPHREGTGIKDNGIYATWLGLIAFTFFFGTFVAANVYLRGWAPDKFTVDFGANADLPAITTLILLATGFILLLAGNFFRSNAMSKFNFMMILATLGMTAYAVTQIWLMVYTHELGPHAWTTHMSIYFLQLGLALTCIAFMMFMGKYFSERNMKALNRLVPAAMSVFLYTVATGVLTLVITDMISVGEFAEWCGTRIMELTK
jgi:magnesium-transporting ATPase (P-type)